MLAKRFVSEGQCTSDAFFRLGTWLRLCCTAWAAASIDCLICFWLHFWVTRTWTFFFFIVLSPCTAGWHVKAVVSMIHHDWVKCNDLRQISGVCKLAQRQGPKYDIGLFHKYVVSPRRFGIGSHRSDWDGGQARFVVHFRDTPIRFMTSTSCIAGRHGHKTLCQPL